MLNQGTPIPEQKIQLINFMRNGFFKKNNHGPNLVSDPSK